MKSITIAAAAVSVLLMNSANGAEGTAESHGARGRHIAVAPVGGLDGEGARNIVVRGSTGHAIADCIASIVRRVYPPEEPGLAQPDLASRTARISVAPALEGASHESREVNGGKTDSSVLVRELGSDDLKSIASQTPCVGQTRSGNGLPGPLRFAATPPNYQLSLASVTGVGGSSVYVQMAGGTAASLLGVLSGPGPWTERYEYDVLGRLRKVTFPDNAVTNYTLDNAGNRTNVATSVP